MCKIENDDDMKIVGVVRETLPDTAEIWSRQKKSGNIDRAHRLGGILAQHLITIQDDDPAIELQKQMLFAFVLDMAVSRVLREDVLVQTARGTFFEKLRALLPGFEDTLHRLGAFTFYRMCLNGEDALPAEKIGKVYAALCGKEEDETVVLQGTDLVNSYLARLQETLSMVEFQIV